MTGQFDIRAGLMACTCEVCVGSSVSVSRAPAPSARHVVRDGACRYELTRIARPGQKPILTTRLNAPRTRAAHPCAAAWCGATLGSGGAGCGDFRGADMAVECDFSITVISTASAAKARPARTEPVLELLIRAGEFARKTAHSDGCGVLAYGSCHRSLEQLAGVAAGAVAPLPATGTRPVRELAARGALVGGVMVGSALARFRFGPGVLAGDVRARRHGATSRGGPRHALRREWCGIRALQR